jgi:hypothetical protein
MSETSILLFSLPTQIGIGGDGCSGHPTKTTDKTLLCHSTKLMFRIYRHHFRIYRHHFWRLRRWPMLYLGCITPTRQCGFLTQLWNSLVVRYSLIAETDACPNRRLGIINLVEGRSTNFNQHNRDTPCCYSLVGVVDCVRRRSLSQWKVQPIPDYRWLHWAIALTVIDLSPFVSTLVVIVD